MIPTRLYAILDHGSLRTRGLPFQAVARGLLRVGPAIVQYRAKGQADAEARQSVSDLIQWRDELAPRTRIFVNDRPELAARVRADGVHVGQHDMAVDEVRVHFPRLDVGISTHNREEFARAVASSPTYVALGPLYQTGSKANPEPVVPERLVLEFSAIARDKSVPFVGIGGITIERARALRGVVDQVAVIAALLEGARPETAESRVFENAKAFVLAMSEPVIAG